MSRRFNIQIESDVPNGTAPMIVDSSTLVTNFNADLLDGQHGSYYAPIASPTFTGTVNLPTVSISGITTTSNYINRTTGNGNSSWLQQDGTGRVHWYWNTLGGTSPTFTNAAEDASALTLHVNNNGNGGTFFHRSANGASASAGGPITWTTTLYVDLATITYKGNRIPTVTDKLNAFAATTSAELAGVISDETGSGSLVFATSPSLTTPNIGVATGTSLYVSGSFNSGANGKGGLASKAYLQGASIANAVSHLTLDTLSAAQGERSGMSFYSTFQSTADNGSRRTADILAGFNGGAWGTEYLAFHVGLGGPANDAQSLTTERLRISKDSVLSTVPFIAPAATTSIPSIRLPHGTAPTTPTNGDMWTTTAGLYVRVNGSTVGPVGTGGGTTIEPFFLSGM